MKKNKNKNKDKFKAVVFDRGLITFIITFLVSTVVSFALTALLGFIISIFKKPNGTGLLIVLSCFQAVASFIVAIFKYCSDDLKIEINSKFLAVNMGEAWEKRITNNKPMKIGTARLIASIQFFIAIIVIVVFALFTLYLKNHNLYTVGDNTLNYQTVITVILIPIVPVCLVRWKASLKYLKDGYCPQCGALYSYVYGYSLGTTSYTVTEHVTTYNTKCVGSYYDDYGKVNVYTTVANDYTHSYPSSHTCYKCRCGFCGNEIIL